MSLEQDWVAISLISLAALVLFLQVLLIAFSVRQRNQVKQLYRRYAQIEDAVRELEHTLKAILDNHGLLQDEVKIADTPLQEDVAEECGDNDANDQFREKVMSLIAANYADPSYSPTLLIEGMCMSRSLFHRKSTSLLGQSAGRLINSYRMDKAKELILSNRDMNISDVAYAVGFNDPKYFTRYFTKFFGCSPTKVTGENQ